MKLQLKQCLFCLQKKKIKRTNNNPIKLFKEKINKHIKPKYSIVYYSWIFSNQKSIAWRLFYNKSTIDHRRTLPFYFSGVIQLINPKSIALSHDILNFLFFWFYFWFELLYKNECCVYFVMNVETSAACAAAAAAAAAAVVIVCTTARRFLLLGILYLYLPYTRHKNEAKRMLSGSANITQFFFYTKYTTRKNAHNFTRLLTYLFLLLFKCYGEIELKTTK